MSKEQELNDFPALKKEIEKKKDIVIPLTFVTEERARQIEEDLEKEAEMVKKRGSLPDPYRFAGYNPDVIDFLRRCDNDAQAHEIIDFLEKRGELTVEEAKELREKLAKDGVRGFGEKKQTGYYFDF